MLSPAFCLETGVEADQEGMIRSLLKDVLFRLDPVYVLEQKQRHCILELRKAE